MPYPYGTPATGVLDIFTGTSFSPNDIVIGIRDNYSAVNRTTMLNSLGYQVGLVQNFVNSTYLGRPGVPVQNAYFMSGWASGIFAAVSGTYGYSYDASLITVNYVQSIRYNRFDHSYTRLDPDKISYQKSSAYAGNHSGGLDYSGLYLENSTYQYKTYILNGSGTPGLNSQATWKVTGTDYLYIGNDSAAPYSGKLTLKSNFLELWGPSGIYLKGVSPSVDTKIYFCGTSLVISGGDPGSDIKVYNNIYPTTDGQREIGDAAFTWKDGYINGVYSTIFSAAGIKYNTFFGGVCGATEVWNFDTQSLTGGSNMTARAAASPNKFLLSRISPSVSGYLQINSGGQLEFYKIGSSGWVLTNF